jgi:hypothetical protein
MNIESHDLTYLGEGNANIAFLHHPTYKVVRIGKSRNYPLLQSKFIDKIIRPILGSKYVGEMVLETSVISHNLV